jgi:hypothetical protein
MPSLLERVDFENIQSSFSLPRIKLICKYKNIVIYFYGVDEYPQLFPVLDRFHIRAGE